MISLAKLLDAPIEEVAYRLGLSAGTAKEIAAVAVPHPDVALDDAHAEFAMDPHGVELEGTIQEDGTVVEEPLARFVPYPLECLEPLRAFIFSTGRTRLDMYDGAVVYTYAKVSPSFDHVGRLCILRLEGEDHPLLGVPVLRRGLWDVLGINGSLLRERVGVLTAAPVLWIKL